MLIAAAALCLAPNAQASTGAAQKLVDTYSPIVMLRAQTDICDPAQEQFEPTTVGVFLDNPQTQLDAPDGKLVTKAPTAADVAGLGDGYHLNIPGDPLSPGCNYSKAFKALKDAGKAPPITYARIATEEGHTGLVVQYWFFYYFNQFNDLHEGDWEGMQIAFDGSTPRAGPGEPARRRSRSSSTRAARRAPGTTEGPEGGDPPGRLSRGGISRHLLRLGRSSSRTRRAVPASGATTRPHRSGGWSPSRC